jgi:hypothetical protein
LMMQLFVVNGILIMNLIEVRLIYICIESWWGTT